MLSHDEQIGKALNLAYFFLKFRPRTKKEITRYLLKKSVRFHFDTSVVEEVVEELESQDLINDQKFIEWFIEERSRTKQKSSFVLKQELTRFGVDRNLIDEYFTNHSLDETSLALKALKGRWYRFQNLPYRERFQKASQFLARRGFSFEIIKKAIKKLEKQFAL